MLRSVKSLEGFAIAATDGPIGKVQDFYFDDQAWVIRYVVVDTSSWLGGRDVLISPYSISQPSWSGHVLPATITKEQIKNSPDIDTDKPVSRQYEKRYLGYYGYPYYWGGASLWGAHYRPRTDWAGEYDPDSRGDRGDGYRGYLEAPSNDDLGDPHLRSCNAVQGYHIRATDGDIGHVQGYLLDDVSWSIRYLIVNTSNWWLGHSLLISPEWIHQVSWEESYVDVSIDRQTIKTAPVYDPDAVFDRHAETAIYDHYVRESPSSLLAVEPSHNRP
jgi:hypothetical protein